ncbi:PEGA domain-containing protein [bacterium]|nr:PEGA domain-containing protein [bacterium]
MAAIKAFFTFGFSLFFLVSCSGGHKEQVQLFHGPCKLRVVSSEKSDEILVDGIQVGHGSVDLKVPCGHRQVRIARHHHVEFLKYVEIIKGQPVEVKGSPEPLGEVEDIALSEELIQRLREGKSPVAKAGEAEAKGAKTEKSEQPDAKQEETPSDETPEVKEDDWS